MAEPIRILLLEDTPADAELNERILRAAGIDFVSLRVDTREAFVKALQEFHPDLVLSDYQLPGFDGMSALKILRCDHPEVPLIMVTGALSDVEAVELLHAGARDYVLKDRPARLGAAVQRALSVEKGIRARKMAEERFHKISESAQDAIIMMADGRITFWNAAAERIFGYSAAEAIGQDLHALVAPPAARSAFAQGYPRFQQSGQGEVVGKPLELTALRKSGEEFPVELSISATQLDGQWQAVGIVRDITERKQAERALRASEHRFMLLFMEVPIPLGVSDKDGVIVYFNEKFTATFGYTVADVPTLGDWWLKAYPDEDYRRSVLASWEAAVAKAEKEQSDVESDEYTVTCKNGAERIVVIGGHPMDGGVLATFNDITERKAAERALYESEKTYRSLFENMLNGFAYCQMLFEQDDPQDFIYLKVNAAFETLTGIKGVAGKKVSEVIPGIRQSDPQLFERYGRVALSGVPERFEIYVEALQQWFWVAVYSPQKGYFVAVFDVITERKQAELALRRVNRTLRTLSEGNKSLIHATDESQLLQAMCNAAVEKGGYRMAWVGFVEQDAQRSIRLMAQAGFDEGYIEQAHITWADTERGQGPAGRAARSGMTHVVQNIALEADMLPWREAAAKRGYASSIALPLLEKGRCFGVFNILAAESGAFDSDEVNLLEEMAGDLAFGILALRVREAHREHEQRLHKNMLQTVQAIAGIVEMRDPYTSGHQARVAELAQAIARRMGMSEEEMQVIHLAGLVHDLGKISIPAEILSKPRRLNDVEYSLIKMHPQAGYDILKEIDFSWPIAQMVLQHHERMDGTGYPQGLKGEEILLGARILSVADVVEAMSSHRPYRPGLGMEAALEDILSRRGTHFDAQVVDACVALFKEQGYDLPK